MTAVAPLRSTPTPQDNAAQPGTDGADTFAGILAVIGSSQPPTSTAVSPSPARPASAAPARTSPAATAPGAASASASARDEGSTSSTVKAGETAATQSNGPVRHPDDQGAQTSPSSTTATATPAAQGPGGAGPGSAAAASASSVGAQADEVASGVGLPSTMTALSTVAQSVTSGAANAGLELLTAAGGTVGSTTPVTPGVAALAELAASVGAAAMTVRGNSTAPPAHLPAVVALTSSPTTAASVARLATATASASSSAGALGLVDSVATTALESAGEAPQAQAMTAALSSAAATIPAAPASPGDPASSLQALAQGASPAITSTVAAMAKNLSSASGGGGTAASAARSATGQLLAGSSRLSVPTGQPGSPGALSGGASTLPASASVLGDAGGSATDGGTADGGSANGNTDSPLAQLSQALVNGPGSRQQPNFTTVADAALAKVGNAPGITNVAADQASSLASSTTAAAGAAAALAPTPAVGATGALTALSTAQLAQAGDNAHQTSLADQMSAVLVPAAHQPDGSYQVNIRLQPDDLGVVHVELRLDAGTVSVSLHAEGDATRDMLRQNLGQLRQQMAEGGLTTGNFDVGTGPGSQQQGSTGPTSSGGPVDDPGQDSVGPVTPGADGTGPSLSQSVNGSLDMRL